LGTKGSVFFLVEKDHERFANQMMLEHAKHGSGGPIRLLNDASGIGDQVAMWGKVKQLLIPLALSLHRRVSGGESFILLA
jgi:hypothetical protein